MASSKSRLVAFVPVRGGSKGIPNKNIRQMSGRPLVHWVLDAAVEAQSIKQVVVSTDSELIGQVADDFGSEKVVVIGRSPDTASDSASTESALLEFAEKS